MSTLERQRKEHFKWLTPLKTATAISREIAGEDYRRSMFCPIYEIGRFGEARAVVLKITTDEGLFGLGEGTLSYPFCLSKQVVAAIAGAKQYLIGSDPLQIEKIWHELYDRYFWRGGPVEGSAQGAINYALWDIFGKSVNMPVYQLLGGAYHERIPIYLNGWWEGTSTTKEVVERALVTVEKGATRLKWYPFEFMSQIGKSVFRLFDRPQAGHRRSFRR